VGAAQYTQRKDAHPVADPLGLMIGASRHALADAGVDGLPAFIDTVCVVNSFSLDDEDTPRMLSHALGIRPQEAIYTLIGGNTPQMLVNQFSRDIAAGRRRDRRLKDLVTANGWYNSKHAIALSGLSGSAAVHGTVIAYLVV
jgi:acetyl-CoA C-acetyltransferase